jgi:hypothetical protein
MVHATATPKAGDELMSWCTKCKEMHLHRIKAVDAKGKPARVICTCPEERERNYRPDPPKVGRTSSSTSSSTKAPTKRASKKSAEDPHQWEKLYKEADASKSRDYLMSEHFYKEDLIQHKTFGPGIVTEILDAHKMVVVFEDKTRIMVFNKH